MNQYACIEWPRSATSAEAETDTTDALPNTCYRWGVVTEESDFAQLESGSEEQLFEWLTHNDKPVVLVIPGEKVVSYPVPRSDKEKRHFAKMLPFMLEDDIVDDVETLHFAIGQHDVAQTPIAYVDQQWFDGVWRSLNERGCAVIRCITDFQCIRVNDNETVFWFDDDRLLMRCHDGSGFTTQQPLASTLLQKTLSRHTTHSENEEEADAVAIPMSQYRVHITQSADNNSSDEIQYLFGTLATENDVTFYHEAPLLSFDDPRAVNFCSGPYADKTSMAQQVKSFTGIGMLSVVAMLVFIAVNLAEIYVLTGQNQQLEHQIETAVRTVIPQGVINDPVRQLRRKLAQSGTADQTSSQVVYLLSHVAPVIQSLAVELSGINYSYKEQSMRINIQADSFNMVEKLRTDLMAAGLSAELLHSNAIDEQFQARLRIGLGEQ